jgi:hypothetical protein
MGLSLSDQGSAFKFYNLGSSRATRSIYLRLTLTLLVPEVVADNHDATLATNNFALIANFLHAWLDLHALPSFI